MFANLAATRIIEGACCNFLSISVFFTQETLQAQLRWSASTTILLSSRQCLRHSVWPVSVAVSPLAARSASQSCARFAILNENHNESYQLLYALTDVCISPTQVKCPYNVNKLTSKVALSAFAPDALKKFEATMKTVLSERTKMVASLKKLPEVKRILPTDTNFLMFSVNNASKVYVVVVNLVSDSCCYGWLCFYRNFFLVLRFVGIVISFASQ